MIFFIYQIILIILLFISPLIIIIRIFKKKEDKVRFKEKFCFFSKKRGEGKLIWFHGSSVGEIMSVIPIIRKYDENKSFRKILITSSTLSSAKILEKIKFKKVIHQFYPIDTFFFSNKFLNYWKPDFAIFLESEIWPSMYKSISSKKIPLILLNARITSKTFYRWLKIKKFSKSIFNLINFTFPQNSETNSFLKKLDVKKIKFIGNLKYVENKQNNNNKDNVRILKKFKKYKTFVAASTHYSEEILAAKVHLLLKKVNSKLITIIIPRHVHRTNEIIEDLKNFKLKIIKHSSNNRNLENVDIYLVDTFGESKKFYKFATTVFLGGSIVNRGGQNPLEAARYGAKILHGPNVDNFREIYNHLKSLKISSKAKSPSEFARLIVFKKNMHQVSKIKSKGKTILKQTLKELDKIIKK